MQLPRTLANLITQANRLSHKVKPRLFSLNATIVTPTKQIPLIIPTGMSTLCAFGINFTDDFQIRGQLQPSVYQNDVLGNKDDLYIEVIERQELSQIVRKFRAVPLGDANPQTSGRSSKTIDLKGLDELNLVTVTFQLFELGYDKLKNIMVSDILLMTKLDTALLDQYALYGEQINLDPPDNWKGVNIVQPIDNDRFFKQIVLKSGVPLTHLARYLQNHDEFGIYNTGLGSYYRKGFWYVYPLLRLGRYEQSKRVLNIFRVPEDVFPTIEHSYFDDGRVITIISTGGGELKDSRDISKQNEGTGKRIISSDSVMGETGYYYSKGQAILTREDSVTEVRTSGRANDNELVPFVDKPTNNACKLLSENAYNEGVELNIQWHNSLGSIVEPCMPVRYYYMDGEDKLLYREGVVLGIRMDYHKETETTQPFFREHSVLDLFLSHEEHLD